jgi:hypothetical protein
MKNIRTLLLFLLPLAFMSCTDTREELEIKGDGSGTLVMKTDLGKMLDIMKGFGGNDLAKDGLDKPFDTIMFMKNYVDTAKNVTPEQKDLLREGKVHLILNMNESIGKIDMNFPFSSSDKLQQLYANLNSSTNGLKNIFDGVGKGMQKGDATDGTQEQANDKSMPQIASVYDITVKNGLYSRKVNKQRYDEFAQAMKLDDLKQMGGMMGDMKMDYTLSIKLPRPIKKINNSTALLSSDKKTVTLAADLMETFQHPELLALELEY